MKRIYLVDVSSLFFRAFYAVRPLTSPSGTPVNAIYGFLSMLLKLMKDEKPDSVVFCYDTKDPSFRKDLYDGYKANRSEMPEDLRPQIPYIKKIADDLGIPSLERSGFEADDLIGTLSKLACRKGYEVFIVSGDKDFAQLIEKKIWMLDTMKNVKIGPDQAKEKWGVTPEQMVDYLALVGDSSDNVPGVKGIGPKGAQKLLEQYQDLDGIYKHIDEIKGSTHEKLKTDRNNAYLSQKLVTIVTDMEIPEDMEHYHLRPARQHEMRNLLTELNFKGFEKSLAELPNWNGVGSEVAAATEEKVEVVTSKVTSAVVDGVKVDESEVSVSELAGKINAGQELWAFSHDLGLFVADDEKSKLYWVKDDASKIRSFFDEMNPRWKGFDLKALWHQLNLRSPQAAWDSALASYVVRTGDSVEWNRVYSRAMGGEPSSAPTPVEKLSELRALQTALEKELSVNHKILSEIEMPLLPILYRMERRGIRLDQKMLAKQGAELGEEIATLEKQIHDAAGTTFNIGSPKQLGQILFENLKLPAGKKTKTGYSTGEDVLEKLKELHPIAGLVLQYRELTKLKSTYVDSLPQMVKDDGRIHTTFNQAHTATGRLSSVDPNLQNIPIRTERGARVRKAFIAEAGCSLMSVDYSQVELRILADYANDPGLIKAFQEDLDIHAATASEVFSIPLKDVTAEHRRVAKAVNFGIAYGQGAFGLSETLGISRSEAKDIIDRYFNRFKGVKTYIEETVISATEKGYVETLFGRRRYMDELKSSNAMVRKFGERAAINAPIQGTAADIVKKAMIEVDKTTKSPMLLQVHDELIFEGTEKQLKEEAPAIVKTMEGVGSFKVPLKVNWAIGPNWDSAHG